MNEWSLNEIVIDNCIVYRYDSPTDRPLTGVFTLNDSPQRSFDIFWLSIYR